MKGLVSIIAIRRHKKMNCDLGFTMSSTIVFTPSFTIYGLPGYIRKFSPEIEARERGRGPPFIDTGNARI
jgi:hypothetical protein